MKKIILLIILFSTYLKADSQTNFITKNQLISFYFSHYSKICIKGIRLEQWFYLKVYQIQNLN